MRPLSVFHVLALSLALAGAGGAQTPPKPSAAKPAPAGPAVLKLPGNITLQGSFRSRLEMWDWFDGNANDTYAFSGNILRLSLSQQREKLDWQLEFAAPFLLGLPDDAISATGAQGQLGLGATYYAANGNRRNAGMIFPKQAFVRFKSGPQSLRVGRFEFSDGGETMPKDPTLAWVKRDRVTQRLIGPFAWSHTGRSFDGAHYAWNKGLTNFTFVGAIPTRGAFQVDGWGQLDVALGYAALTRQVQKARVSGDYRAFGIYYHDWRRVVKTDSRPLAARRADMGNIGIWSFGGHALNSLSTAAGTFDTMLWGLGQTGRWGRLDHRGWAYAAEVGWQPEALPALKPWLRAGYSHTSGDENPADGTHKTFFQILPTPRPFARFPFFDMVNNEDLFGMLILRPHAKLTIRPEVHGLRLSQGRDLWYLGGGAFQPWTFGYVGRATSGNRGLATLYDVSADVTVNQHVSFTGYVGHAAGHSAIRAVYPQGAGGTFGYLELLYRF